MSVHSQMWFSPDSTMSVVEQLSEGRPVKLGSEVEQLVLRRLVDQRECPLCLAEPKELCQVYGGMSTLMRTHPMRLKMTATQRSIVVEWALRTAARRAGVGVPEETPAVEQ